MPVFTYVIDQNKLGFQEVLLTSSLFGGISFVYVAISTSDLAAFLWIDTFPVWETGFPV